MDSYIADRIGRMNALIICNIISGLSSFLIWVFAYDYNTMMAFAVVFGLVCSIYFSSSKSILHAITKIGPHVMMIADNALICIVSTITATIVGIDRFPTGLSVLLMTNMVPVWGPSIASAVEARLYNTEPYFSYKMFTGVTFLLGGLILFALKIKMTKSFMSKI